MAGLLCFSWFVLIQFTMIRLLATYLNHLFGGKTKIECTKTVVNSS